MPSDSTPQDTQDTHDGEEVVADVDMADTAAIEESTEAPGAIGDETSAGTEAATQELEAPRPEETEGAGEAAAETVGEAAGEAAAPESKRVGYASYLSSPVVALDVGSGDERLTLSVHQALLVQSPYFARICAEATDGTTRSIAMSDANVDAVGCFLEYLYTGDYFPRKLAGHAHQLERDPLLPEVDETGDQLLKHARVYTLGGLLELPALQTLATSKIHCINSTARGEIAYARYIYAHTTPDNTTVRSPVARFWATRSHTLRAEAEAEFQALCLEFPQFSYDVLTRVLDEKLKRERSDRPHSVQGSTRKRARNSAV